MSNDSFFMAASDKFMSARPAGKANDIRGDAATPISANLKGAVGLAGDMNTTTDPTATPTLLNAFLADRDTPCPLCGYNLRMLAGDRCPECGNELRLQVGLVEPRMGWYIAALVVCCVGLGGSMLVALLALGQAPPQWWRSAGARCLLLQLALTGILLPVLLAKRRAFRMAPTGQQRTWVLAIAIVVLVLWTLFLAVFDG